MTNQKRATWRWRSPAVYQAVLRRALDKADYSGAIETAEKYLTKIRFVIETAERNPELWTSTGKPPYRFTPLPGPSPGEGDVVVWSWDGAELVGEGVYSCLPPAYQT
jgi:hypothetical protein